MTGVFLSNLVFVCFLLQGCGLYVRVGRGLQISGNKQNGTHTPRTSALYGGLRISIRETSIHGMVCTELLLPVWKFGKHP
jgi:hypothetical protein